MFDKREPPESFPCSLRASDGESYTIESKEHYDYLNRKAGVVYHHAFGYEDRFGFDYFCSNHPQESNSFVVALILDDWIQQECFHE